MSCDTAVTIRLLGRDRPGIRVMRHLMGAAAVANLPAERRAKLAQINWNLRTLDRGVTLALQGEERTTISVMLSGWAFRFQSLADGKRQILDFALAGTLIGFGSGGTSWYGVETITPCVVASLPRPQFYRLLSEFPELAVTVAERIADSEMRAHGHVTSLGRKSARERVAGLIVELLRRGGRRQLTGGEVLNLPLTQIMIGDALGLSNEHVCRTLAKLADDGVVAHDRHTLTVRDPRLLMKEAGIELEPVEEQVAFAA
jgi:CRP/FNR family transcriptional regulator